MAAWWNQLPWDRDGAGQKPYRASRKGLRYMEPMVRPSVTLRAYKQGKKASERIVW